MSNHNVNAAELRRAIDECSSRGMRNVLIDSLIDNHPAIFLKLMGKYNHVQVIFKSWQDPDKISVIKLIRHFTGLGLAESKRVSEEIAEGKPFVMYFKKITHEDGSVRYNLDIPNGATSFVIEDANKFLAAIKSYTSYNSNMKFEIK